MLKVKEYKGITLIALIISIVVLLILAGITISSLTGSDSAPAKANEASQKNDIGTAKDDLSLVVVNAKMQGMENAYVENGVSASGANTIVGKQVISEVRKLNGKKYGVATLSCIPADGEITDDLIIEIKTTDCVSTGKITLDGGNLEWTEGILLSKSNLKLLPGSSETLTARLTDGISGTVEWGVEPSNSTITIDQNGKVTIPEGIAGGTTAKIVATVNEKTAKCKVTVVGTVDTLEDNQEIDVAKIGKTQVTNEIQGLENVEDVTYSTTSTELISINEITGEITPVNNVEVGSTGTIILTGKISNKTKSINIKITKATVSKRVSEVTIEDYGKIVSNYTTGGRTYRIFYIDTLGDYGEAGNVYLKADYNSVGMNLGTDYNPKKASDANALNALNKMKSINPKWADLNQSKTTIDDLSEGEKAITYLCDSSNFESFLNTDMATEVIGAPSIEMFLASYNQTHFVKDENNNPTTINTNYIADYQSGWKGYKVSIDNGTTYLDSTSYNTLTEPLNDMYIKEQCATILASPVGKLYNYTRQKYLFCIYGDYGNWGNMIGYSEYNSSMAYSPLVTLKSNAILKLEE